MPTFVRVNMTGILRCDAVCFGNRNQSDTVHCRGVDRHFGCCTSYRAKNPQLFEKRYSLRLQVRRAEGEPTVVGSLQTANLCQPINLLFSRAPAGRCYFQMLFFFFKY